MTWSNLPGLSRALSKQSGLFVAAITITSLLQTSSQSNCQAKGVKKKKKVKQITAHCSAATLSMKMGKIHNTIISNHLLSVDFLHSFSLQDLLCTPPLHGLQANSIHLIEKHGQETRLCAVGCLSGWPRVDQRVDLIKEQDRRSAGTGLAKELHTHTDS